MLQASALSVCMGECGVAPIILIRTPPDRPRMAYTQDPDGSPMASSPRAVAVDPAGRGELAVWVTAMDL